MQVENQCEGHVGHWWGLLWWLQVVGHNLTDAPGELVAAVRPDSRAPVAVATGLCGQQVEQRVAVPGIVPADAPSTVS